MAEVNAFICYRSYIDAANMLPEEKRWPFFSAIVIYALDGVEPNFTDYDTKLAFTLMRANIDSCNKRYLSCVENGKKGGRPPKNEGEKKPSNNPAKPNHNLKPKPSNNLNKDKDDNKDYDPYPTDEGALSAPPPSGTKRDGDKFQMSGKWFEYYISETGERRVRPVE